MACHAPTIILTSPSASYIMPCPHEMLMSQSQREVGCCAPHIRTTNAVCHHGSHGVMGLGHDPTPGEGHTVWNMVSACNIPCQSHCKPRQSGNQCTNNQGPSVVRDGMEQMCEKQATQSQHCADQMGHHVTGNRNLSAVHLEPSRDSPCYGARHHTTHGQMCHAHEMIGTQPMVDAARAEKPCNRHQDGESAPGSVALTRRRRNRKNKRRRAEGQGRTVPQSTRAQEQGTMEPSVRIQPRGEDSAQGNIEDTSGYDPRWLSSGQHTGPARTGQYESISTHPVQEIRWDMGGEAINMTHMHAPENLGYRQTVVQQSCPSRLCGGGLNVSDAAFMVQHAPEMRRNGRSHCNPFTSQPTVSVPGPPYPSGAHSSSYSTGPGDHNITSSKVARSTGHIGNERKKRASGADVPLQWANLTNYGV